MEYPFILHGHEYQYDLDWIVKVVKDNKLQLSMIDQKIKDAINVQLTDERINEIVTDLIANISGIINVRIPPEGLKPATGDGTANDTEAIQGCINYAAEHGGQTVFFPSGSYLVSALTVPHDVSLVGMSRYTTKLVLAGGATMPLLTLNGMGNEISNLHLDGNAGIQVNDVDLVKVMGADTLLTNLTMDDCYVALDYSGTNGHLQIDNVVVGNCVKQAFYIAGDTINVQMHQVIFNGVSAVRGINVIEIESNMGEYSFYSDAVVDTCLVVHGNDNYIDCQIVNANTNYTDNGLRNTIIVKGKSEHVELSEDRDITVRGGDTLHVDGAKSVNVGGNSTEIVQGNRSTGVVGTNTESYTGDTTENYSGSKTVVITGRETKTAGDSTENITRKKTINAEDVVLNPTNPVTYNKEISKKQWYDTIPIITNGDEKNIILENKDTEKRLSENDPINAIMFGVDNTGTDDASGLINELTKTHDIYFPPGVYKLNSPINIVNKIIGSNTALSNSGAVQAQNTIFIPNSAMPYMFIFSQSKSSAIEGICLNCNNISGGINVLDASGRITIKNVSVYNLTDATGVNVLPSTTVSRQLFMNECLIDGGSQTDTIGIKINNLAPDCYITNTTVRAVKIGINCDAANMFLSDSQIWCGMYGGATAEWWGSTIAILLSNCAFSGTHVYLDTAFNIIRASNSVVTLNDLMVWFDSAPSGTGISNASLFSNSAHDSYLYVNGGFIFGNRYYSNTLDINVFLSNVTVASDLDTNRLRVAYPSTNTNTYRLRSEALQEIARIKWDVAGIVELTISNQYYNLVKVYASLAGGNTKVYKITESGGLTLYYNVKNNILRICVASEGVFTVTINHASYENNVIIYPLNVKADRITPIDRTIFLQSELTLINEKTSTQE